MIDVDTNSVNKVG